MYTWAISLEQGTIDREINKKGKKDNNG